MTSNESFAHWIIRDTNWSRGTVPMASVLLALSPFLRRGLGKGAFAIFLQLPLYMVHQYEEHGHGAFKAYANEKILRGRATATDGDIFVINIVGVWVADLIALYRARSRGPAAGLLAPYLSLTNSLVHLVPALKSRTYNPGAWTAGLLLLPVGLYGAIASAREGHTSTRDHIRALVGGILMHVLAAAIIFKSKPGER